MTASFHSIDQLQQLFSATQWNELMKKVQNEMYMTMEEIKRDVVDINEEQFLEIQLHQLLNEGQLSNDEKRNLFKFIFSLYPDRLCDLGQDLMCDTIMQQNKFGQILAEPNVNDVQDIFTTKQFKQIVNDVQNKTEKLPEDATLQQRKAHTKNFLDNFMKELFNTE